MDNQQRDIPTEKASGEKGVNKKLLIALIAGGALVLTLIIVIIVLLTGGDEGTVTDASDDGASTVSVDSYSLTAPNLVGKIWNDDLANSIKPIVILSKNIVYDTESDAPAGEILSQTPEAGEKLYCDENGICNYVKITVSGKEFSNSYQSFIGKTAEEAMDWLIKCGVKLEDVYRKYSASTTGVGNGCVSAFTYDHGGAVEEGTKVKEGDRFILSINSYTDSVSVPHLGGKSFDTAMELLYESKLNVGEISYKESGFADGTVLSQSPSADETAYYGDKIDLVLSKKAGSFKMPSLLGLSREDAEKLLADYELELGTVEEVSDRQYDHGTVCYQNVAEGDEVYAATVIDIRIAKGGKADDSIDWDASTIIIDITENTVLSAGTLEKLTEECADKKVIAMGEGYSWLFPEGAEYPRDDATLELGILINKGEDYADYVDKLRGMGHELGDFVLVTREGDTDLPVGTTLSLELGFSFSGFNVNMLVYDEEVGEFTVGDKAYAVTENGSVNVPMEKGKTVAFVTSDSTSYSVKVSFTRGEAYCEEGDIITVNGGESVTLHFGAEEGFEIVNVSLNGVTLEGVTNVYTIPKVEEDHTLLILTAPVNEE